MTTVGKPSAVAYKRLLGCGSVNEYRPSKLQLDDGHRNQW